MARKQRILITTVALLAGFLAVDASAERRALLIGINDYSGEHVDEPSASDRWPAGTTSTSRSWRSLSGAVPDAESMRAMLVETYRLAPGNVTSVLDHQATRSGVRQAIAALVAQSRAGDEVLVYYSGHGSQVRSARPGEVDGLDETLVPADSNRGAADIRDVELRRWLNGLLDKGVVLTVILDSCHSGSGVRGDPPRDRSRAIRPMVVPRLAAVDGGPPLVDRGALVLSASVDRALAYERCDDERCFGVFTRALLEAMRLASPLTTVDDLFRRTRARLRRYNQDQEPTLLGSTEARQRSLFGGRRDRVDGRSVVAVESVRVDGRLTLQGGWVNGLTEGSELALPGTSATARVVALEGLDRAVAEVESMGYPSQRVVPMPAPGTLLSLVSWAPPPGRPLRFWLPAETLQPRALSLATRLKTLAGGRDWQWVEDPANESPTHVLAPSEAAWTLFGPVGDADAFSGVPTVADVDSRLTRGDRLYVHLPPPEAWAEDIRAHGTKHPYAFEIASDAPDADYVLASAISASELRYAWLHRSRLRPNALGLEMPARGDWVAWRPKSTTPRALSEGSSARGLIQGAANLSRVHGWLTLQSEQWGAFPYRLALVESASSASAPAPVNARSGMRTSGRLRAGGHYEVALRADRDAVPRDQDPHYVYVFSVDSFGRSVLLFPREGSIENRFPQTRDGERAPPAVVHLERAGFDVVPPYGQDIYFLFTSSVLIHDVGVFEWDGARSRGVPVSPIERLIASTASGRRGSRPGAVPSRWSIERLVFDSGTADFE